MDTPAGDDMANLLEYALGLDPMTPNRDALPEPEVTEEEDEHYLTLSLELNPAAVNIEVVVGHPNRLDPFQAYMALVRKDRVSIVGVLFTAHWVSCFSILFLMLFYLPEFAHAFQNGAV